MIKLGVTGGIGSGKSYVCRILDEKFSVPVYNCDIHARVITLTDPAVIASLSQLVQGVYREDGELDKQRLADYLFASPENAARVNAIIHPAVRCDIHRWLLQFSDIPVVAIESAILYESGFDSEVDRVLYVDAPLEVRLQRVSERDGLSRDEVLHRMQSQRPDEARRRADFCLANDGQSDIDTQLTSILSLLK